MIFETQRFLFGFIIVISLVMITACTNRPAAEKWKYTSNKAELIAKPNDYIYVPKIEADGSLNANETRKLELFLKTTGFKRGDRILINTSDSYRAEGAALWISYWFEGKNLEPLTQIGSLGVAEEGQVPEVQIVVRRYKLSLANCQFNMAENINTISSIIKKVHGCSNQANLGHMIANPSHLALGSPTEARDGTSAVIGIEDYWSGETKPLSVDEFDAVNNSSGGE